ncbi:nucleotidyltransferase domain-containing protein [Demequina pelophila]|uniref:nucleotidyltransferase domain-containing protein n=1 Tax=Demequina pelophila TaxID=1638984 RepID=UPI0009E29F02|nr:nucleotidyltransferase domain-containing protein [Demequina pelophila]
MTLVDEYLGARRDEDRARLRRALALRAMAAGGMSQRQIAERLGISQPAVSQQFRSVSRVDGVAPHELLDAAAPVLKALAAEHGYTRLAVFGSVARREARQDSDIDLLVEAPVGTSSFEFVAFARLLEEVLGRDVDLVPYGSIQAGHDDDILRDAMEL